MINKRAIYTANTGMVLNSSRSTIDGTGTLDSVIAGAANGTLIKSVTVKGIVNTTRGMIRLFVYDGVSVTGLIGEIEVPAVTASVNDHSFSETIDLNFNLQAGCVLKVSNFSGESIQIIADGLDWTY